MPMPRVEIEDAGTLSFPVPDAQIAAIVRRAKRAPYGRGPETIVDTSVRKGWQGAPGKGKLARKYLGANFENIPFQLEGGVGCGDPKLLPQPFKLLCFCPG